MAAQRWRLGFWCPWRALGDGPLSAVSSFSTPKRIRLPEQDNRPTPHSGKSVDLAIRVCSRSSLTSNLIISTNRQGRCPVPASFLSHQQRSRETQHTAATHFAHRQSASCRHHHEKDAVSTTAFVSVHITVGRYSVPRICSSSMRISGGGKRFISHDHQCSYILGSHSLGIEGGWKKAPFWWCTWAHALL